MLWTFGQSLPLSAMLLYLSFKFEIRLDLFKFAKFHRRGVCNSSKGIGIYFHIMKIVSLHAVYVNFMTVSLEIWQFNKA